MQRQRSVSITSTLSATASTITATTKTPPPERAHEESMLRSLLHLFLLLFAVTVVVAVADDEESVLLETSVDGGSTWSIIPSYPVTSPPPLSLVRVIRADDNPSQDKQAILNLPSCALSDDSLEIRLWKHDNTARTFGMFWRSRKCNPHHHHHLSSSSSSGVGVRITAASIRRPKPRWIHYVELQRPQTGEEEDRKEKEKEKDNRENGNGNGKKRWFAKSLPYIMIFVGIALAQGIKKGLEQIQQQMDQDQHSQFITQRTAAAAQSRIQTQTQTTSGTGTGEQVRVVTARNAQRPSTVRSRKKTKASSSKS